MVPKQLKKRPIEIVCEEYKYLIQVMNSAVENNKCLIFLDQKVLNLRV